MKIEKLEVHDFQLGNSHVRLQVTLITGLMRFFGAEDEVAHSVTGSEDSRKQVAITWRLTHFRPTCLGDEIPKTSRLWAMKSSNLIGWPAPLAAKVSQRFIVTGQVKIAWPLARFIARGAVR